MDTNVIRIRVILRIVGIIFAGFILFVLYDFEVLHLLHAEFIKYKYRVQFNAHRKSLLHNVDWQKLTIACQYITTQAGHYKVNPHFIQSSPADVSEIDPSDPTLPVEVRNIQPWWITLYPKSVRLVLGENSDPPDFEWGVVIYAAGQKPTTNSPTMGNSDLDIEQAVLTYTYLQGSIAPYFRRELVPQCWYYELH